MKIERAGRDVNFIRVCDECDQSYTKGIDPNEDEWEDILRKAELGLLIITQHENEIDVRESYYVCPDCNLSTHMDEPSDKMRQLPESEESSDEITFPHPFFKADFTKPKTQD